MACHRREPELVVEPRELTEQRRDVALVAGASTA
jgi:hypothetical protein